MIEATLSDLTQTSLVYQWNDVVHLTDSQKQQEIGFFIPINMTDDFISMIQQRKQQEKMQLLARVAKAQRLDPIEENGIGDGIA